MLPAVGDGGGKTYRFVVMECTVMLRRGGNRALSRLYFIDRTALPEMGKPTYSKYTLRKLQLYLSREWGEKVRV